MSSRASFISEPSNRKRMLGNKRSCCCKLRKSLPSQIFVTTSANVRLLLVFVLRYVPRTLPNHCAWFEAANSAEKAGYGHPTTPSARCYIYIFAYRPYRLYRPYMDPQRLGTATAAYDLLFTSSSCSQSMSCQTGTS